ncbi:RTX toxin, partial [Photobacterium angustum]
MMYVVIEGIIWKITDSGEWVQIPPSEIIDQSIPFIEERAYINDILKTQTNQDDAPVIESSSHRTQFFLDANVDQEPLSSNSASFISQIKATLAETLPKAGFSTRSMTSVQKAENESIADAIPSLKASATLTASIVDGNDGYKSRFETPSAVLLGDAIDIEDGRIVIVNVTDINGKVFTSTAVVQNQKWIISNQDLSSLAEGELSIYASVTDFYGNVVDAKDTTIKDTFAEINAKIDGKGDNYLSLSEITNSDLLGEINFVESDQPISITITDSQGKTLRFETINDEATWQINDADLSSLAEGELTVLAETVDIAGNPASATSTIIKDTLATITADFDGNGDRFLNQAEVSTTELFGTIANIEDGQTVTITVTDSQGLEKTFESTISAGKWSVSNADLTDLAEGEITVLAESTDIAGNPASATNTIIKDTAANITTSFDGKGDAYLNAVETPITDVFGAVENIEDGQTVTITITDSSGADKIYTTTVNNGKWTVNDADLTSLAEGQLTITTTATDIAGNTTSATNTIIKDTLAEITANFEANGDSFLNKA